MFAPTHRTLTVGLLLVIVIVAFESNAVSTVLPRVTEDLHGLNLYGWASSAFLLGSLFGAVSAGALSDRRGPAPSATASLCVFAAGLLVVAFAPSMPVFVMGRFLQGLGAGGLGALPFAVITTHYPEALRARMLALVSSAWLLPALIGPLIASLVAQTWSWRAVFWGLLPLLALFAPLCVAPLRQRPPPSVPSAAPQLGPALLLTVSAGALIEAFREPGAAAWALALGGAFGVVLATRALFPRGLWRIARGLPAALMLRGLAAFAVLGTASFLPLAMRELHALNLTQGGLLVSVGGVSWTLGSLLQSRLEERYGVSSRAWRVRGGMLAVTLGLIATALPVLGVWPVGFAYAGWLVCCVGMGVGYNSNSLLAMASSARDASGRLSGQLANIEVLMNAVAAGLTGSLVARVAPLPLAFALAFAVVLLASLLTWLASTRLPTSS